jgi:hypothetical protein
VKRSDGSKKGKRDKKAKELFAFFVPLAFFASLPVLPAHVEKISATNCLHAVFLIVKRQ